MIDKKNPYYELSQSIGYVQDKQNKLSKNMIKEKRIFEFIRIH